ncbi:MAG: hypothetical protein HOM68_10155 [Gemmatimonadetes bacterium]|jgi:hypothetical protein|nr:hypothetical protein [Gemmatimonadota bacterium]MBT5056889.1 hypothetical protein [Gemmatimonadota bacterium]MBT5145002.1 hypothetical protein [Gemmatimonadota bacterium]MBT5590289.1 hypothetical protein [Gemmatimonadota bacterium]MBT5963751.1 hypothetical protein [Gemmatimonadota bacterium]
MRKFRFLCLGVVAAAALSLAVVDVADAGGRGGRGKGRRGPERGAVDSEQRQAQREQHRAQMATALGLTQDQQAQLDQLHKDSRAAAQDLRASGEATREDRDALREAHREARESILTADQLEILEGLRAERPEGRRRGRRHRDGEGTEGRVRLGERLGLTQEQTQAVQSLRATHREQMEALRESGDISRDQLKALRGEHREQVRELLTEDQQAALDQLRAEHQAEGGRRRGHRRADQDADQLPGAARSATESNSWGEVKKSVDEQ